jgi:hypothetical protein
VVEQVVVNQEQVLVVVEVEQVVIDLLVMDLLHYKDHK